MLGGVLDDRFAGIFLRVWFRVLECAASFVLLLNHPVTSSRICYRVNSFSLHVSSFDDSMILRRFAWSSI